jgi:hypothetical protein
MDTVESALPTAGLRCARGVGASGGSSLARGRWSREALWDARLDRGSASGGSVAIMAQKYGLISVGRRDCRGAGRTCQRQNGWRCDGDIGKASHIRGNDQPLTSIHLRLGLKGYDDSHGGQRGTSFQRFTTHARRRYGSVRRGHTRGVITGRTYGSVHWDTGEQLCYRGVFVRQARKTYAMGWFSVCR